MPDLEREISRLLEKYPDPRKVAEGRIGKGDFWGWLRQFMDGIMGVMQVAYRSKCEFRLLPIAVKTRDQIFTL